MAVIEHAAADITASELQNISGNRGPEKTDGTPIPKVPVDVRNSPSCTMLGADIKLGINDLDRLACKKLKSV